MEIKQSFLQKSPEEWNEDPDYQEGRTRIKSLHMNNDKAFSRVMLFKEFNNLLINNEEEKQFLLQVVEANRKAIPVQSTKKSVIDWLNSLHEIVPVQCTSDA